MTKFYFAEDGNWGGADGLAIVDTDGLDDHFEEYIEWVTEYDRPVWAAWFVENNHPMPDDDDDDCYYCENFELGSLADIDKMFGDDDEDEDGE